MYVYFYLFTRAGLARLDAALLEAAASLGASRWRTLLPGHPAAAAAGARRRGAAHLHDGARLVLRALPLRRRLPGDDHPDRRLQAQRRARPRPGRDGDARRSSPCSACGAMRRADRDGCRGHRRAGHRAGPPAPARARWPAAPPASSAGCSPSSCCCRTPCSSWSPWCRPSPGRPSPSRRCSTSATGSRCSPARAPAAGRQLALDGGRRHRPRPGARLRRRPARRPSAGRPSGRRARGADRHSLGGAGHRLRHRAGHHLQRPPALDRPLRAHRHPVAPAARLPGAQPAADRPGGARRAAPARPGARGGGGLAGRRALAPAASG